VKICNQTLKGIYTYMTYQSPSPTSNTQNGIRFTNEVHWGPNQVGWITQDGEGWPPYFAHAMSSAAMHHANTCSLLSVLTDEEEDQHQRVPLVGEPMEASPNPRLSPRISRVHREGVEWSDPLNNPLSSTIPLLNGLCIVEVRGYKGRETMVHLC
jgi:hypothetical protein